MTPRPRLIVGNWKMHKTIPEAVELVKNLADLLKESPPRNVTTVLAPPFTALSAVASALTAYGLSQTPPVSIAAQDMHWEDAGAYTGEVSPPMLKDPGCRYVIVGHSERRRSFGETDAIVRKKVLAALRHGLRPIVCIGEAHRHIRARLTALWGHEAGERVPILYGGSVTPENIGELLAILEVDGALVGGACLDPAQFARMLAVASSVKA